MEINDLSDKEKRTMEHVTDEKLMEHYRLSGDRSVLGHLLRRHAVRARGAARLLLRDTAEAQDAVQEAFICVLKRSYQYNPAYLFAPWFYQILRNTCLDIIRKRGAYIRALDRLEPEVQEETTDSGREAALARTLLANLPKKERQALELRIDSGLGLAEIGSLCGCSEEAAKKRVQRGLHRLREAYDAQKKHSAVDFPTPSIRYAQ